MILFHWKFYLFFACCLFLVGAPSPMPTGAHHQCRLKCSHLSHPLTYSQFPHLVVRRLNQFILEGATRVDQASSVAQSSDTGNTWFGSCFEPKDGPGIKCSYNLIRNQGDWPDSLALARFQITHPNFDKTDWRSRREALSRYVKLPCFLFPLFVYAVSKEICWQIIF